MYDCLSRCSRKTLPRVATRAISFCRTLKRREAESAKRGDAGAARPPRSDDRGAGKMRSEMEALRTEVRRGRGVV